MADALLEEWLREEATPFTGWDFSHIYDRWHEDHPPWSYEKLARDELRRARAAVDLGTGGGERLSRLADAFRRGCSRWRPTRRTSPSRASGSSRSA